MHRKLTQALRTALTSLPRGYTLDNETWTARHRTIVVLLWVHVPVLLAFGSSTGHALLHSTADATLVIAFALVASLSGAPRRLRAASATLGLVTCSAVLVHLASGLTEMHFHFFVVMMVVSFYNDWTTFLIAIGFVLLEHGVVGVVAPHSVYSHGSAWQRPWLWAGIHALALGAVAICSIISWRLQEKARATAVMLAEQAVIRAAEGGRLEAIGRLAGGVAHELNTPLQFIGDNLAFVDHSTRSLIDAVHAYRTALIEAHHLTPSMARDLVRRLDDDASLEFISNEIDAACSDTVEGVKRCTKIVQAMKSLSHPDAATPELADINSAINSDLVVAASQLKHVADVVCELGEIPLVPCYLGEINQVLLNLFVNAADAIRDTGRRGQLRIATWSDDASVHISVTDDGTGIDVATIPHIFEPFFTTKEVGMGTGQGLALAYDIVKKRHGGQISCNSEVNVGTTFTISLPFKSRPLVRRIRLQPNGTFATVNRVSSSV